MRVNSKQRVAVTTFLLGLAMIPIGFFWAGIGIGLSGLAVVAGSVGIFMFKRRTGNMPLRISPRASKLTYSEKVTRLGARLHDPQWRRYGILLLGGNALGIVLLFGIISIGTPLDPLGMGLGEHRCPRSADRTGIA